MKKGALSPLSFCPPFNLAFQIPDRLSQILDSIVLQVRAPDILDSIAQTEAHMFRHLNALDAARVSGVVLRTIHRVMQLLRCVCHILNRPAERALIRVVQSVLVTIHSHHSTPSSAVNTRPRLSSNTITRNERREPNPAPYASGGQNARRDCHLTPGKSFALSW